MSAFSFKWRFWRQHSIKMICIPILTSKGTTIHFISYFVDFSRFTPLVTVLPPQCTCSCEWRNCDVCTKSFYCCSLAPPIQCLHFGPTHCITGHLAQTILLPYGPVVFIVVQILQMKASCYNWNRWNWIAFITEVGLFCTSGGYSDQMLCIHVLRMIDYH